MKILFMVLIGLVVLIGALGLQMFFKNKRVPENLGVKEGMLAPLPASPNAVSSQTEFKEKYVKPFPFKETLQESKSAIEKSLKQYGNMEIINETPRYIHAVNTTRSMKFKDDLEFYFDETHQKVHFRSASRIGHSDMGQNRERYEDLMKLYDVQ